MLLGLFLFALGGVVAALADSMFMLIAGRALQGCGAIAGVAMAFAADFTRFGLIHLGDATGKRAL